MNPMFIPTEHGFYLAANKDAVAVSARLSKMRLNEYDLITIRGMGYVPRLTNGSEIGKVEILA